MADTLPTTGVAPGEAAFGVTAIDYSGGDQTVTGRVRAVAITTAGTLKFDTPRGDTVTLTLAVGEWHFQIVKIYQTGSDAAGALFF